MTIHRFAVRKGRAAGCVVYVADDPVDNHVVKALAAEWNASHKVWEVNSPAGPVLVTYHRPRKLNHRVLTPAILELAQEFLEGLKA